MSCRPFISVVIPTFHRNDLLAKCLDRLAPGQQAGVRLIPKNSTPVPTVAPDARSASNHQLSTLNPQPTNPTYEVIVTDDGRNSTSESMIRAMYPWVRWLAGPQRGPAANRNHGAQQARGEWLAFVDDDCIPAPGWLQAIAGLAHPGQWDVIEGKTAIPDKVDNPFRQGVENLYGNCYWSCNLAVRREVFLCLGGFDEDFREPGWEDMEFAHRFRRYKLRCHFAAAAAVAHPIRQVSLKSLLCDQVFRTRWIALYHLKTGHVLPPGTHPIRVVFWRCRERCLELLRTTWHLFKRWDRHFWRHPLFRQFLRWLLFPIAFPVLVYWDLRFQMASRIHHPPTP